MKKRDKFWLERILWIFAIIIIFIIVSLYNIVQFNSSYIFDETTELDIFRKQIEWAVTPMLKENDLKSLNLYSDSFKFDKEFAFRIFDSENNLLTSSSNNISSKIPQNDSRLSKTKYSIWKLYRHSFKDKKLEKITEFYVNKKKYFIEVSLSEEFVIDAIIKAQKNIIMLFVVFLVFLIISLIQIFYSMRKSFNSLEDSVTQIAQGNLDAKIKVSKNGLLEELTLSLIKMTKTLKMQIERLSQLEQYKTEFIQNITHEIKTPITAINSAVELIEFNEQKNDISSECYDIIKFQVNAIDKLVSDILALSETDLKKTDKKNFKLVSLNLAIKKAIENQGIVSQKINISGDDAEILADEDLLITAISNLLSNAIKYSKSEKIDIKTSKNGNKLILEVKDYGIGVPKEHLKRIFERFYRVDKSRSRKNGGTGLGLAIVKNIIELHNWEITADSEIGKWTSFKIIINC